MDKQTEKQTENQMSEKLVCGGPGRIESNGEVLKIFAGGRLTSTWLSDTPHYTDEREIIATRTDKPATVEADEHPAVKDMKKRIAWLDGHDERMREINRRIATREAERKEALQELYEAHQRPRGLFTAGNQKTPYEKTSDGQQYIMPPPAHDDRTADYNRLRKFIVEQEENQRRLHERSLKQEPDPELVPGAATHAFLRRMAEGNDE